MSYLIRLVEEPDRTGVYAVERECFLDPYPSNLIHDLIRTEHKRFFVAVEAGKVIGYAVATAKGSDGHVVSVAVHPRHRRRGIGTALLSALTHELKEQGLQEIHLEVRKGNQEAILFYEQMGFRRFSEIKRYYADGEDACVLRLAARSASSSDS